MIYLSLALIALAGFVMMLTNFVERPDQNDSGGTKRMEADYHPKWPPGNDNS
jgi:hypothetical protein